MSRDTKDLLMILFNVVVGAAALKAAIITLREPWKKKPTTALVGNRRLGPVSPTVSADDVSDTDPLDYEALL